MDLGFLWGWKGLVVLAEILAFLALTVTRWDHVRRLSRLNKAVLVASCLSVVAWTTYLIGAEWLRNYAFGIFILSSVLSAVSCFVLDRRSQSGSDG